MPRGYRRRYRSYRTGRSKYSNQTTSLVLTIPSPGVDPGETFPDGQDEEQNHYRGCTIVPSTAVYGTRKAKNFDVQITTGAITTPVVAALVYVPQGTLASNLNVSSFSPEGPNSLYEPNQNVIGQFVIPATPDGTSQSVTRFKTRLARNLDSGDSIVLIMAPVASMEAGSQICATVNYAIKY